MGTRQGKEEERKGGRKEGRKEGGSDEIWVYVREEKVKYVKGKDDMTLKQAIDTVST